MNLKKLVRLLAPIVAGAGAAVVAILLTRPLAQVEPDFDVPTEDQDVPWVDREEVAVSVPVEVVEVVKVPRQRNASKKENGS